MSLTQAVRATAEGAGETPNVLSVPLDEFIIGLASFLIVFLALGKLALPKIAETLKKRTDAIEGGLERAEKAQSEARLLLDQYRQQIAGAHDEAATIRAKAESDGRAIIETAKAQAESERATIAARAETQLAAERSQTIASLRQDVGGLAVDLAGRIVGESLSDDDRARAVVDRFIADLERAAASKGPTG